MNQRLKYAVLLALITMAMACNKKATVKINVTMQSTGHPVVAGANIGVMLHHLPDSANFTGKIANDEGVVMFDNVTNGNYYAAAEHWDGSNGLRDSKQIQIQNGHDAEVTLLLH